MSRHRTTPRRRRTALWSGAHRRPAALVAGVGLALGAVFAAGLGTPGVTEAAQLDQANLDAGIGNAHKFDIALVKDGLLQQADVGEGLVWSISGADALVPGHTVSTVIPVVNNGPYDAEVSMTVQDVGTDPSDPVELYRWTVQDAVTGEVLAGDATNPLASTVVFADVSSGVGSFVLLARGADPVDDGAAWTDGAAGSARQLKVTIAYPDSPSAQAHNGGSARLRVVFDAESA
ncbi:hypothetical protein [Cellulomonas hominis]